MKMFWNERYAGEEYVYGVAPNIFFKDELKKLKPGKILLPMEGEGRNAVYAAKIGWEVVAYDFSEEGKAKAEVLAKKHKVNITYLLTDNESFSWENESFDVIGLIYTHMLPDQRVVFHKSLISLLKPHGEIIMEVYSNEQLERGTGGPSNIDLLMSEEGLREDFNELIYVHAEKCVVDIQEGTGHSGMSSVIRLRARK